ncbi:MAG: hypothetical protein ACO1N9_12190 [Flavobacterium sp.]
MTELEFFLQYLNWLSPLSSLMGFTLGLYFFKSINNVSRGITVYLAVMFLVDIGSRVLSYYLPTNLVGFPVYCLIELTIFTYFYHKYFLSKKYYVLLILNVIATLFILAEIVTFSFTSVKAFQSYAKVFDNFGIILLALTYCYEKLDQDSAAKWDNFRLNMVVLIFFTINLIFFLPFNFIINDNQGIQFYFWLGITVTTVLFYAYLTSVIWQNAKKANLAVNKH